MSDELNSQLSAFVDDELAPEESELLVRRLCRDAELRHTAASYAVIGDVLRDELPVTAPPDFSARIMMAVEGQTVPPMDVPTVARSRSMRHWGIAAAASVVLAAIALMTLPERVVDELPPVANSVETTTGPLVATAPTTTPDTTLGILASEDNFQSIRFDVPMTVPVNRQSAENQARLNNLLLRHLNTTGTARQGLLTYRNVGFVTQPESER
ncbi:MAG: sigma-E factor negative regulatory protein [Gammaproteobacteria bacterium]|nr:sigma-E factor negative regulatory protein [Gammaproteobacteria bacterium]